MKNSVYVQDGHVSAQWSTGAFEISYKGSKPENIIRVNHPNESHYFADNAEAAEFMELEGTNDVSLLPVDIETFK